MDIERLYSEHYLSLSGIERVARSLDHLSSVYEILLRKVSIQNPDANVRDLKKLVAKQMYGTDPQTLALIERAR